MWKGIQDNIYEGQRADEGDGIISRVFRLKLKALEEEIIKDSIFGPKVVNMRVIEFQKRFPRRTHAHYLTTVNCNENAQQVDLIVSAEIPQVQKKPFGTSTPDETK